jgi:hypothetical protein
MIFDPICASICTREEGRRGGEEKGRKRTSSASCTRRSEKVMKTYKKAIKKPAKQP